MVVGHILVAILASMTAALSAGYVFDASFWICCFIYVLSGCVSACCVAGFSIAKLARDQRIQAAHPLANA